MYHLESSKSLEENEYLKSIIFYLVWAILGVISSDDATSSSDDFQISGRVLKNDSSGAKNWTPVFIKANDEALITFVNDFSGSKPSGSYSSLIRGFEGDVYEIGAWDSTHFGESEIILQSGNNQADIVLNQTLTPEISQLLKLFPTISKITEAPVDSDGDSLYNYLALDMDLNVPFTGKYFIFTFLKDAATGKYEIEPSSHEFDLKAGKNRIKFNFSGTDIFNAGRNDAFIIGGFRVSLKDNFDIDDEVKLDYYVPYTTLNYKYIDFQRPWANITKILSDKGVDENQDGFFDYLALEAEINAERAGNYEILGDIFPDNDDDEEDNFEEAPSIFASEFIHLEKGINRIQLKFSGAEIFIGGIDGQYPASDILLYDAKENILLSGILEYTTSSYQHTQFHPLTGEFTGIFTDKGEDLDGDGLYNRLSIGFEVNVSESGEYDIESTLVLPLENDDGLIVSQLDFLEQTVNLTKGKNIVYHNLSGPLIRLSEISGTYDVEELILYHNGLKLDKMEMNDSKSIYTTQNYDFVSFQEGIEIKNIDFLSDSTIDSNGNGLYDNLTINGKVDVNRAGNYWIFAVIDDQEKGINLPGFFEKYLGKGSNNIQLNFNGELIYHFRLNGPFALKNVVVFDPYYEIEYDIFQGQYATQAYDYKNFEHSLPASKSYDGSTTDFSKIEDLRKATNIKIEKVSKGRIDFGNNELDLSGNPDLEAYVKISDNFIGIDSANVPELNKPALLTLSNLKYDKMPVIYYADGLSQANGKQCPPDLCSNTIYDGSTGNLVFNVSHFTSFWSVGSEKIAINELEAKVDGKNDKNVPNGGKISAEAKPGSKVELKITLENLYTAQEDIKIEDITVEATVEEIEDGEDLELESNEFDLSESREKTIKLEFEVPLDAEEDSYNINMIATGKDSNGTEHRAEWNAELEVEKEKHEIAIGRVDINPKTIDCQRLAALDAELLNLGSEEEKGVSIEILNGNLGISAKETGLVLGTETDDYKFSKTFNFRIADNAAEGNYPISVNAYNKDSKLVQYKKIDLKVMDCVKQSGIEDKERVKSVNPYYQSSPDEDIIFNLQTLAAPEQSAEIIPFTDSEEYLILLAGISVLLIVMILIGIVLSARTARK